MRYRGEGREKGRKGEREKGRGGGREGGMKNRGMTHLQQDRRLEIGLQVTVIVVATGLMHAYNVLGNGMVGGGVALVQHHEEEIEAAHNGGGDGDVPFKALTAVVTAKDGVGGGEDRGASVQGGVDAGLGGGGGGKGERGREGGREREGWVGREGGRKEGGGGKERDG